MSLSRVFRRGFASAARGLGASEGDAPVVGADGELEFGPPGGGSQPLTAPTEIAGCALWLDASQLDLANDDPVSEWGDLSANGFVLTSPIQDDTWTLDITGASEGTVTVSADGGSSSIAVPWNQSTVAWGEAMESQTDSEPGDVIATSLGQVYTFVFDGTIAGSRIPLTIESHTLNVEPVLIRTQEANAAANQPIFKAAVIGALPVVRFDTAQGIGVRDGDALDLFRELPGLTVAAVTRGGTSEANDVFDASLATEFGPFNRAQVKANITEGAWEFGCTLIDSDATCRAGLSRTVPVDTYLTAPLVAVGAVAAEQGAIVASASGPGFGDQPVFGDTPGLFPDLAVSEVFLGAPLTPALLDAYAFVGDIAEVVVYQRALNTLERRQLLEYLSSKWATL